MLNVCKPSGKPLYKKSNCNRNSSCKALDINEYTLASSFYFADKLNVNTVLPKRMIIKYTYNYLQC